MFPDASEFADAGPHVARYRDAALSAAFRDAVRRCRADGKASEASVAALCSCARVARVDGLAPEQMVLIIRQAWDTTNHPSAISDDSEAARFQLTDIALTAYFAER